MNGLFTQIVDAFWDLYLAGYSLDEPNSLLKMHIIWLENLIFV